MYSIALCPNCGGQKTVSKPLYIAGDVNSWVSSGTSHYPCPTCDGRGWIQVDSVPQEDFVAIKSIALSSMETAENLMDECTKRADKIKELETELEYMCAGECAADKEIERLRMKIFDIEGREDLVTAELERRAIVAEEELRVVTKLSDEMLADWDKTYAAIARDRARIHELEDQRHRFEVVNTKLLYKVEHLEAENKRYKLDLELLDEVLKIVNPLIKSGAYAKPSAEGRLLAIRTHGLCQTVVQFRRKHGIVG